MLSTEKINIYKKHSGNIDSWARLYENKYERKAMNDDDWGVIDSFIQDIQLIEREMASKNYEEKVLNRIKKLCDSQETIDALYALAKPKPKKKWFTFWK